MNIATFGAFHYKIKVGVVLKAADIIDKRSGKEAVFLEYAGGTLAIIIETNLRDIKIISQYIPTRR